MATIQARCIVEVQSAILNKQLKVQISSSYYNLKKCFILYRSLIFLKLPVNFQMLFYAQIERIARVELLLEYNYRLAVSDLLTKIKQQSKILGDIDKLEIATFLLFLKIYLCFLINDKCLSIQESFKLCKNKMYFSCKSEYNLRHCL